MALPSSFLKANLLLLVITVGVASPATAQVEESSELYHTLAQKDSLIFDEGFNRCNYGALEEVIANDLEFYHDTGGIQDREAFFKATRENICSSPDRKPIRELVPGSLTVFPLRKKGELYGAIQKGEHRFYIKEPGKEMYLTSIAKFTHLWLLREGKWKLTRVLSYDHRSPEQKGD